MTRISLLYSRAALIISCLLIFIAAVAGLCGGNSIVCFSVILTDGMIALAWLASACALGAVVLRLTAIAGNRPLLLATAGGLGLGIFSLLALALGLLGWLNRPVAIAFPVTSIALFLIDLLRRHPGKIDRTKIETWLRQPAGTAWLWLVPMVSLAFAAVSASMMPGILWKPMDPSPYDVTSYHLQVPREWYEAGRIMPLPHNVFSYFAFNVEMQFLLLMHATGGPWAGMYACQFLNVGYAGLIVLAVYGASLSYEYEHRTSNVERPTSKSNASSLRRSTFDVQSSTFAFSPLLAAALASTVPWLLMLCGVAYVESALMLYTALSIAWALKTIQRSDRLPIRFMILSGIMAGFACGTKITAVPMLLLAVPVAVFISLRSVQKRTIIGCCALVLTGSLVLSPWLVRNIVWCGNPLFPVGMSLLGKDHFTHQQVERFRVAHSPTPKQQGIIGHLKVVRDDVIENWQFGFLFFPLALVAIAIRWRDRQTWLLAICGLFVVVVWIGFTHLIPRFMVMLIPIAAIAIGRIQWHRAWPAGLVLLLIGAGLGWGFLMPELCKWSNPAPVNGEPQPVFIGRDCNVLIAQSTELLQARDSGMQIGLVGDAQAFLYEIPMKQLHYSTVFNLQGDDPITAWAGPQAKGNPNWFLVINPMEIDRLNETYRYVPALPSDWAAHGEAPFYLRADQATK